MSKFELSADQSAALRKLTDFLADPAPECPYFVLDGSAGTGKTFLLREIAARFQASHGKVAFTAPTNKAAKELRKVTGDACTIYALLGLRISSNGEVKELTTGKPADLSEFDLVVIDEAGMIPQKLFKLIEEVTAKFGLKIVFSGDRYQLPPVKERASPIWDLVQGASLKQVMRHDNQILTFVTRIREAMKAPVQNIAILNDNADGKGVFKVAKMNFKKQIFEAALEGKFVDTNACKVIAWRNVKVLEYNRLIRSAIFGAGADIYEVGEKVIAASPCVQGDEVILATDEEAIVESVAHCLHPLDNRFRGIELKARTEQNKVIRLLVLDPASEAEFKNACQTLAHEARANPKKWKAYWSLVELFHDVKYAYAITAHRAQGSTYDTVYVDYQDILMNRERMEAFQCLYVASSRPRHTLYLA